MDAGGGNQLITIAVNVMALTFINLVAILLLLPTTLW